MSAEEEIARIIARALGHNDDQGSQWERYVLAARLLLKERAFKSDVEQLANWMFRNHFTTGHGDTIDDLLKELTWQIQELRDKIWELEKP